MSCSPSRSDWTSRADQPRGCVGDDAAGRVRPGAPIRAALLVWENRQGPRVVHVPYVVEQDEDGVWCTSAQLRPGVGAAGDGATAEAAVADLRDALEALLVEVGPPDELTLTVDVA